jgi:hypothetical protein
MADRPPSGIPSIIRTGFADDAPNTSNEFVQRMTAMAFALVSRAARHAAMYASHAHRNEVTPIDINMGLRYSARHFFDEDGFDEVEKEVNDISSRMETEEDDDGEDDDSKDVTESSEGIESEEDDDDEDDQLEDVMPWTRSTCECGVCAGIHETETNWDEWMPEDPVEMFLKTHADRAINQMSQT